MGVSPILLVPVVDLAAVPARAMALSSRSMAHEVGFGAQLAPRNGVRPYLTVRSGLGLRQDRKKTKFGPMKYSRQIKPISYLKANAAAIMRELAERREPLVITQNGEAKAVMQDVASYEQTQETLALLKILALGNRQIEEGKVVPAAEAIARLREKKTPG